MDTYHIWCNLREGVKDIEFCAHVERYLGGLREKGLVGGHRITRRKLGFGPPELGEFHITIEVRDLAQLDAAFRQVARREGEVESHHAAVYRAAKDVRFALYRDFPGSERE